MKRLFIAIKVNPTSDFLDLFDELKKGLNHEKIKWVKPDNLHLTLKFFGETPTDKIDSIITSVSRAIEADTHFELSLENIGIFGSRYQPKVIWAGFNNSVILSDIVNEIHHQLKTIGYLQDRQNFIPHLTLARIKQLKDKELFQEIIADYHKAYFQKVAVKKLYLYESILKKTGAIYKIIHVFDLQA